MVTILVLAARSTRLAMEMNALASRMAIDCLDDCIVEDNNFNQERIFSTQKYHFND